MFPQSNHGKVTRENQHSYYLFWLSCIIISLTNIQPTSAHKVKISADVGATIHIEPNDNPRAGVSAQTWFALTRKGGKEIPLNQCNCQLAVYAEPHTPNEPALLEPSLKSVNAERYQGIPGAEITFPKAGIYQLQLSGKPTNGGSFKPFKFDFEVTVVGGSTTNNTQTQQNVNISEAQSESKLPLWAIALPIVVGLGVAFAVLQRMRGGRK